jgi:hypothetical protein
MIGRSGRPLRIDMRQDRHGEWFSIVLDPSIITSLEVLDVSPEQRHLLLMARERRFGPVRTPIAKQKFLCGHDERAWFVAAVPENAAASSVATAMDALKPPAVLAAVERAALKRRDRNRRKNRAFIRQGEWFFIPRPLVKIDSRAVLRAEPLRRGLGKPHWAEFCYRKGGELVYVSRMAPNGFTQREFEIWRAENPKLHGKIRWTPMRRNPQVFVRGRIRHPDHKTVILQDWHEVQMNTETQARAMQHVAFLD